MSEAYTRTLGARDRDTTIPRFHMAEFQDEVASAREGRPIFRQEERVEVIMPGNTLSKPVLAVTDAERQRWPEAYERFKKGLEMALDGTPLEQWSILNRAQVKELKAIDINTVEDCAGLSDIAIQRIPMYGRKLRDLAKAYLDDAERMASLTKLTGELERRDVQILDLTSKVEQQAELLERLSTQLLQVQNAPSAIAALIPGQHDPVEQARQAAPQPVAATSSLDALMVPKRGPGRPRKDAAA